MHFDLRPVFWYYYFLQIFKIMLALQDEIC